MPNAPRPAVRWILLAACLLAGLACFRLGVWQLDRLGQRRAQNALIVERTARTPMELSAALALSDPTFQPVIVRGQFDSAYALYLADRARDEVPGAQVVAPLRSDESDVAILVNLGWVGIEQAEASPPSAWLPPGMVELYGVLRASQVEPSFAWLADPTPAPGAPPRARWRVLYISGIQAQTPYALAPYFVALTEPTTPDSALLPTPEIDLSDGPHLSYAIQWFAFGTTAIVGGIAWARSARRKAFT
jgi:surfeit locus 1 family protein